jgi:hypothetical protein
MFMRVEKEIKKNRDRDRFAEAEAGAETYRQKQSDRFVQPDTNK